MKDTPEEKKYRDTLQAFDEQWENTCRKCGACCGALDDPCEHLIPETLETYSCQIYGHRFGEHKTRSGKVFRCVPVRDILCETWPGDTQCAYKINNNIH